MQFLLALVAMTCGFGNAIQAGSNQLLQKSLSAPLWSVSIISAITLIASLPLPLLAGEKIPAAPVFFQTPWWAWIGGIFGLGFVLATVYLPPKLGAGLFLGLIVTSSVIASLVLDHFGWLGFPVHIAGYGRVLGGLLMIVGIGLIAVF